MPTVHIRPENFPAAVRALSKGFAKAVHQGLLSGVMRGIPLLQQRSRAAAFNTGLYTRGWKAGMVGNSATQANSVPYAGVIELGRRPGGTPPPTAAIARWAQLKLHLSPEQAQKAAYAIARAVAKRGTPAHHVLGGAVPQLLQYVNLELTRELAKAGAA